MFDIQKADKTHQFFIQKRLTAASLMACSLIFSACSSLFATPTATPTPSPSPTETPTIIWFPPTNTASPRPSPEIQPTLDYRPGMDGLLFEDTFEAPELWNTALSASASVIIERNMLTMSITAGVPSTTLVSLRSEPSVGDFYAEATVRLGLCRGNDRYGLVFRAVGAGSYYRYVLNCQGGARLERLSGGSASAPRDWQISPDVPLGAPGEVKIGVWAVRQEMRFFLNDRYQFSITDSTYALGMLGLFISSSGSTPVSVSFSDMAVYVVSYVSPIPPTVQPVTATP